MTLADEWLEQMIRGRVKNAKNVERALRKDILPLIGTRQLSEITPDDVLAITDAVKRRGSNQMALKTYGYLRRIFDYAISRQKLTVNPAHAIEGRFIATARSRDVALTKAEIGGLMAGIYRSSLGRAQKLAIHLLMICHVSGATVRPRPRRGFEPLQPGPPLGSVGPVPNAASERLCVLGPCGGDLTATRLKEAAVASS